MRLFGPYHKRSRSASMQLSINAIVILVMAMAVLGLGLGMVRGLLGSGVGKLEKAIGSVELAEKATAGKHLAGITGLKLKRNVDEPLAVSFYNTGSSCTKGSGSDDTRARLIVNCDGNPDFFSTFKEVTVSADAGQATTVGAVVQVNGSNSAGVYGCSFAISCGETAGNPNIIEEETTFIEVTS